MGELCHLLLSEDAEREVARLHGRAALSSRPGIPRPRRCPIRGRRRDLSPAQFDMLIALGPGERSTSKSQGLRRRRRHGLWLCLLHSFDGQAERNDKYRSQLPGLRGCGFAALEPPWRQCGCPAPGLYRPSSRIGDHGFIRPAPSLLGRSLGERVLIGAGAVIGSRVSVARIRSSVRTPAPWRRCPRARCCGPGAGQTERRWNVRLEGVGGICAA